LVDFVFVDTHIPKKKWFHLIYVIDWFIVGTIAVTCGIIGGFAEPRYRFIPQGDLSITYPYLDSIVPDWALAVVDFLIPPVIFGLLQIVYRSPHDFHHACLGLVSASSWNMFATEVLKYTVGRPRPDFLAMAAELGQTATESRLSFPSGHSSSSFASMVFLALYLNGKLHIFNEKGGTPMIKALVPIIPIMLSIFVAVSRTVDYHHHFSDIIAGSILGTGTAFYCYFLLYPSLFDDHCHVPKTRHTKLQKKSHHIEEGEEEVALANDLQ